MKLDSLSSGVPWSTVVGGIVGMMMMAGMIVVNDPSGRKPVLQAVVATLKSLDAFQDEVVERTSFLHTPLATLVTVRSDVDPS